MNRYMDCCVAWAVDVGILGDMAENIKRHLESI
jgi:hypothetical protein